MSVVHANGGARPSTLDSQPSTEPPPVLGPQVWLSLVRLVKDPKNVKTYELKVLRPEPDQAAPYHLSDMPRRVGVGVPRATFTTFTCLLRLAPIKAWKPSPVRILRLVSLPPHTMACPALDRYPPTRRRSGRVPRSSHAS